MNFTIIHCLCFIVKARHTSSASVIAIDDFYQKSLNLEFIPAKKPLAFEDSTPNKSAQLYKPPTDEYEFAKYSSQSGYDFVFLLKAPTT